MTLEWTGARYADRPTAQADTHIAVPPDEVWSMIADPLLMPQLSAELQSVEWLDGADRAAVGARFRGSNRHEALGEWATTSTVVECDPPRVFAWAVEDVEQPSAVWRFTLEPVEGGTHVTQWVQLGPGRSGLSLAIDAMPENEQKIVFVRLREFQRGMQANLEQLKQRLEHSGGIRLMRTATTVEGSAHLDETVGFVVDAERLGLDVCWVAEAWGADAPSLLGFLAARTEQLLLGSGIIQVGTRTPVAVAQLAITLANLTGGRFLLGLGPSGPQVIEGLHGVPFAHPLQRMRETVEIVRAAATGEKITYQGREFSVPLTGSDTRPMRLSTRAEHAIPVYLATLSPKMLRLTGELADGWLGTSFVPEGAEAAYFTNLDAGLAVSNRNRTDLDICQGAELALFDDEDALHAHVQSRKKELAFSLGGMGSDTTNFYNQAYSRQGWADVAAEVRAAWLAGDRGAAAELITDDMVLATTLIGTEAMVQRRLAVWRDTGVTTVRLYPAGDDTRARLDTLERGIELVRRT